MTNQNNAAQAVEPQTVLTAEERRAATAHLTDSDTITARDIAIESALLSKLRAEGVPVAEPAFYINAAIINPETGRIKKNIQGGLTWSETRVGGWQMPVYAAPVASAPVADNWRQYALPGETTAEQVCERMNAEVTRRTVAAMRASAPVAGEAQPVAWAAVLSGGKRAGRIYATCDTREEIEAYIQDVHQSSDSLTLYARPLSFSDTAPQASEAVRNARAEGFQAGLDKALEVLDRDEFATRLQSAQVIRALKSQPQADKDGGQQHAGDGQVYGPYRVKWIGAGVWAGITDELPGELEGKDVFIRAALSATQTEQGERDAG